jgi:hypothetical protein
MLRAEIIFLSTHTVPFTEYLKFTWKAGCCVCVGDGLVFFPRFLVMRDLHRNICDGIFAVLTT